MSTFGCPRCLTPAAPDATVCGHCGASLGTVMPAPFFAGAQTWRRVLTEDPDLVFEAQGAVLGGIAITDTGPSLMEAKPPDAIPPLDTDEVLGPPLPEPEQEEEEVDHDAPTVATTLQTLAPVWKRVAALFVDLIPPAGALMVTMLALEKRLEAGHAPLVPGSLHEVGRIYWSLGPLVWLVLGVVIVVPVVYQTLSLAYMGGSVGDLLFGIRWYTKDGHPARIQRSLARALLAIPSWALALSGVLLMLLTRTGRTFYDIASGLYPIKK